MPAGPFPFAGFEAIPINVHSHNNTSNLGVFGIARKLFGKPIHLSIVKLVLCSVVQVDEIHGTSDPVVIKLHESIARVSLIRRET
jgi:hypothetical protein